MDFPTLTSPQHLLWLLLIPVLYWLARPVRPRRTVATPHLAQWRRAMARVRRRPQRVRWLRLWLLILAFSAAVLAFTQPSLGGRSGPRELVVLLDRSASMAAGSTWQDALATLRAGVATLPAEVEVRLALCGESVAMLPAPSARTAVDLPGPAGAAGVDLAALARTIAGPQTAVWTITDGAGGVPEVGALSLVGERADNVALTALDVTDAWPLPAVQIRVTLANFGATDQVATLALDGAPGGAAHPDVEVALAAGSRVAQTLEVQRGDGGDVRVFLRGAADAFAGDDAVALRLPPPPPGAIAVLGDAEAGPQVHAAAAALAEECGGEVVDAGEPRVGFLLAEGGRLPREAPPSRAVTFGTRFGEAPLGPADIVDAPDVLDWDRDDPVTAGLDLSELVVDRALRAEHLLTGEVLVRGSAGPLVVRSTRPEGSSIHTAFRLSDSNFALLPAFPQFLRRAYLASWRADARPVVDPANLLDPVESDLRRRSEAVERPLPDFGEAGRSLAALLLAVALGAAVARLYC